MVSYDYASLKKAPIPEELLGIFISYFTFYFLSHFFDLFFFLTKNLPFLLTEAMRKVAPKAEFLV